MPLDDLAIACNLSPADLRERASDLLPGLLRFADARTLVEEGFAFRFPAEATVLNSIFATVVSERECCPFFCFQLTLEPENGPVWLTLTGPVGTRDFIESLIGEYAP